MTLYEKGDVEVQIQQTQFRVSSSVMFKTSSEFEKLFTTQNGTLRNSIKLPNEDPKAFHLIYHFITQTLRLETISITKLLILLRVAKRALYKLLNITANLMLRGAVYRLEVVSRLLSLLGYSEALYLRKKNELAREQLLDASRAIEEATIDISYYEVRDNFKEKVLKLDKCYKFKRLDFKNMEAYSEPIENLLNSYLEFKDDESVISARTV
ncbi:hypothetical protein COCC4DRAFT_67173 [Bipolaris maydis ATCC 48331]|uniref:BTB domain-containing protein n=1 Tax=Cochliobolus heterostrophus (strain C4 / ATCC 48331 / race T) TaxID=665024 RepID=N4WHH2_COCH4|nr:uncharacterized protein COCC4DRAFT_67173 [Bipolaris maydis ATCC 48331]ENH98664.1 hypothetical protein COCC4DRAFT_67173 [Bipolaris maydis ATCC 48331]